MGAKFYWAKEITYHEAIIIKMHCCVCNINRFNMYNKNTTKRDQREYSCISVMFLCIPRIKFGKI